ncbi:MAG: MmcQ/YjbR family DNA-binding protein [Bacteroidia bacterium]
MNIEDLRNYCLSLPNTTEDFPFDEVTLVIRVAGKIFVFLPLDNPGSIALKCDPEKAIQLREQYDTIKGAYHLNKKHWNSLEFNQVPPDLVYSLIDHSYDLVYKSLPAKTRKTLESE